MSSFIYKPLTHARQIRIVRILPGRFNDALEVQLLHTSLDSTRYKYDALSYVWGSKVNPSQIGIKHGSLRHRRHRQGFITSNLDIALRHMRHSTKTRIVWADAICINQHDVHERNEQVLLMGEIYHSASRVTAFLGPAQDGSTSVFQFIRALDRQEDRKRAKREPELPDDLKWDKNLLVALYHLTKRPWFQRLWIRQEIALGYENARLMCGRHFLYWPLFCESFMRAVDALVQWVLEEYLQKPIHRDMSTVTDVIVSSQKPMYLDTLRYTNGSSVCQDPRDKIYAVLSRLSPEDQEIDIKPDYSKSTESTYIELAEMMIKHSHSLNILSQCQYKNEPTKLKLPSWVPDWSTPLDFGYIYSVVPQILERMPAVTRVDQSDAKSSIVDVMGMKCGTIRRIVDPFGEESVQKSYVTTDVVSRIKNIYNSLQHMTDFYPTGETKLQAFCATLVLDNFWERWHPRRDNEVEYHIALSELTAIMSDPRAIEDLSIPCMRYLSLVMEAQRGRGVFYTSNGYMGMCPRFAQEEDSIVWLFGCDRPMVLRKCSHQYNEYIVVGGCYMHGMMQGQVLLGNLPKGVRDAFLPYDKTKKLTSLGFVDVTQKSRLFEETDDPRIPMFLEGLRRAGYRGTKSISELYEQDFITVLRNAGHQIETLCLI